jgi:hypothetical protein
VYDVNIRRLLFYAPLLLPGKNELYQKAMMKEELKGGSVSVGTLQELMKDYVRPEFSRAA